MQPVPAIYGLRFRPPAWRLMGKPQTIISVEKKQLITFRYATSILVIHVCSPETMPPRLDFPISTAHDIPKEAWYHLQLQLVTGTLLREYLVLAHGLAPGRPEISAYIRWNEDAVASGTFGKLGHGNWET